MKYFRSIGLVSLVLCASLGTARVAEKLAYSAGVSDSPHATAAKTAEAAAPTSLVTPDAGADAAPAPAQPPASPTAIPSPTTSSSTQAVLTGWDVIEQYGPIWGGMLLLFGGVAAFLKKNESKHWIAQGRTLAILVGAAGLLGSCLEAKLNGGASVGILMTLIVGAFKLVNPTIATKAPA